MIKTLKDLTGHRFGKLTVIRRLERELLKSGKHGHYYWLCKCDCGNEKSVPMSSLHNGGTKSCGCPVKETQGRLFSKNPGESGFNKLYKNYKVGAKARGLAFDLSEEEFKALSLGNCHYCGKEPSQISKASSEISKYTYNGIDRINNSKGYELDSCVPCCKRCNFLKRNLTYDEFLFQIKTICEYRGLLNHDTSAVS